MKAAAQMARQESRLPWMLYVAIGLVSIVAYYALPLSFESRPFIEVAFPLANVIAIFVGIRWYRPDRLRPWLLFGVGMSFFFLYNAVRAVGIWFYDAGPGKGAGQDIFQTIGYVRSEEHTSELQS